MRWASGQYVYINYRTSVNSKSIDANYLKAKVTFSRMQKETWLLRRSPSFSRRFRIDNASLVTSENLRLLLRDSWYWLFLRGTVSYNIRLLRLYSRTGCEDLDVPKSETGLLGSSYSGGNLYFIGWFRKNRIK
jgi:hypothetical protein